FEPARVAEQVPALRELLEMRQRLTQLLSKMEGNDKLEQLLADVLTNTDKAAALAKELGIEATPAAKPEASKSALPNNLPPAPPRPPRPRPPTSSTRSSRPPGRRTRRRPTGPRPTSSSSSRAPSSPARSSPRTPRPTSSTGSARSTRSCPASS